MCIKLKHIAKKSSTSKLFCNSTNIFTFYVLPVSDSVPCNFLPWSADSEKHQHGLNTATKLC